MRPTERFIAALIVTVLVAALVIGAFAFLNDASKPDGTPLNNTARSEIEHADCAQLATLAQHYSGGAGSVEPDTTAFRLVRERQTQLGCAPESTTNITSNYPVIG